MNDLTKILDHVANELEKKGLIKEVHEIDMISNTLEKYAGVGLDPLGSGERIEIAGTTSITNIDRRNYQKNVGKQNYYNSLNELTNVVITALQAINITPITGTSEIWTGAFTGALSAGDTAPLKIDLCRGNQKITNSLLILNIYKMEGKRDISYELNTYLS
jgi:hypothetical protein